MSELRSWLDDRRPPAPGVLRSATNEAVAASRRASSEGTGGSGRVDDRVARLAEAAGERLASALSKPGRVREAAFDLLTADALLTYACEAALEGEDPAAALARLGSLGEDQAI
jgi:hypothetical protein